MRQPFGFRSGSQDEQNELQELRSSVESALKRAFRPEFLNRIDDTIVFRPLTQDQIVQIVGLMVRDVQNRISERDITFELTADAEYWLAREGFDPVYGARPLRRAIQRQLENPLARLVLSGEVQTGSHVLVDSGPDGLVLTCQEQLSEGEYKPSEPALV